MKQLFAAFLFTGVAFGSTIPVTGSGSFSLDNFYDTYANACFSGSNGTDSVSAWANGIPIGPAPPSYLMGGWLFSVENNGWAIVDGITGSQFEFSLVGDQAGYI